MDFELLGAAAIAAFVIMRVVDALIKPFFERYELDKFWLQYIAAGIGAPLGWFTGINAFPVFATAPMVGRVITCLVIGLGPSFIYDLTDTSS